MGACKKSALRSVLQARRNRSESVFSQMKHTGTGAKWPNRARWATDDGMRWLTSLAMIQITARRLIHLDGSYEKSLDRTRDQGFLNPSDKRTFQPGALPPLRKWEQGHIRWTCNMNPPRQSRRRAQPTSDQGPLGSTPISRSTASISSRRWTNSAARLTATRQGPEAAARFLPALASPPVSRTRGDASLLRPVRQTGIGIWLQDRGSSRNLFGQKSDKNGGSFQSSHSLRPGCRS